MPQPHSRRRFLTNVSGAALGWGSLTHASLGFAAAQRREWRVLYGEEIEPLVRLIELTERDRCVDVIGAQLRRGLSYREFMSAVFLAGLRNGGDMGYYHCIYVIHAANQLAAQTPVREQLLPLFGALDLFKGWQSKRITEPGHFGMQPLPKKLDSAENALKYFDAAARAADADGTEAAALALSQSIGRHRLFGVLAMQALLGGAVHRSILVANCWRVLEAMNWSHYVPTVRAMSRMLAVDDGLRENWYQPLRERAESKYGALTIGWSQRIGHAGFTRDLLAALRTGDADASVDLAVEALFTEGAHAGALWDAVHLAAAESLVRLGDGNALHENTSLNAQHYAFRTMHDDEDRLMMLLAVVKQAAENYHRSRNIPDKTSILDLTPADIPESFEDAASDIFSSTVKTGAIRKAFALTQRKNGMPALARALRRVVVSKARNDAHPYKIAAANFEDCRFVSPEFRPYLAAAPTGLQRGGNGDVTDNPDSEVTLRAREILAQL